MGRKGRRGEGKGGIFGWMVTMSSPLSLKRHLAQLLIYNVPSPTPRTTNSTAADLDCHDLLTIYSGIPEFGNALLPSELTFLTLHKIPAPYGLDQRASRLPSQSEHTPANASPYPSPID